MENKNKKQCRLKNYAKIRNGLNYKTVYNPNGEYPVMGSGGEFSRANTFLYNKPSVLLGRKGTVDKPLFVDFPFWTVDTMYYTEIQKNAYPKFFYYLCTTIDFQYYQYGSAVPSMTQRDLNEVYFPFVEYSDQQRIADFLDGKCTQIDDTIAKEKELITKLKEYRQSIITEAVTKGLNPTTPMKDSGIDWIGEIPKHWEAVKIKYLFKLRDEKNYLGLKEVCLLSLYTEYGVFPHGERTEKGNKAVNADGYKVVYKNDVVVNIILAWMGAIAVSNYDGVTSPAYDVYKPNLEKTEPKFYHYLFRTKAFSGECYKYGRGIMEMRWRTYSTEFKSIFTPYPPLHEQQEITAYLDKKTALIDNAIQKKEELISKLERYKKSLIYEAVTGKMEV